MTDKEAKQLLQALVIFDYTLKVDSILHSIAVTLKEVTTHD